MKYLYFIILTLVSFYLKAQQVCIETPGYTPTLVGGVKTIEICPGESFNLKAVDCTSPTASIYPTWTLPGNVDLPSGVNNIPVSNEGVYSVKITSGDTDEIQIVFKTVEKLNVYHPRLNSTVKLIPFCDNETITITNSSSFTNFNWNLDQSNDLGSSDKLNLTRDQVPSGGGEVFLTANYTTNNCVVRDTFRLSIVPKPIVDLGTDKALCPGTPYPLILGDDDAQYGHPEFPAGTFNAKWTKPAPQPSETGQYISVQTPGTYIVEVNSSFNCPSYDTVEVNTQPVPELTSIPDQTICQGTSFSVKATVSNPTVSTNNSFTWRTLTGSSLGNNAILTQTPESSSNSYIVRVLNEFDCFIDDTVNVDWYPNQVQASVAFSDTATCGLDPVLLVSNGINGYAPYTYEWFPGADLDDPASATPYLTPVPQDTINYSVVVTDAQGCKDTATVTVKTPDMKVEILEGSSIDICRDLPFEFNAQITGGVPNFTFRWMDGTQTLKTTSSTSTLKDSYTLTDPTSLTSGKVRVEVDDDRGCPVFDEIAVNIVNPPQISYTSGTTNLTICAGESVTFPAPLVNNGTGNYEYVWSDNSLIGQTPTYSSSSSDLGTKTFSVQIKDAGLDCPGNSVSLTVDLIPSPSVSFVSADTNICDGAKATLTPTASGSNLVYQWKDPNGSDLGTSLSETVSAEGDYTIIVTNTVANCSNSATKTVHLIYPASFASINGASIALNNTPYILEGSTDGQNPSYQWTSTGMGSFDNPTAAKPVYNPSPSDTVEVVFTLTLDSRCASSPIVQQHTVLFKEYVQPKENILFVPTAFAPADINVKNQTLLVFSETLDNDEFTFTVYNRWGEKVFETFDMSEASENGWNGKKNNTGAYLKPDVYTYIVKGKFIDGQSFEKSGTATLIR